MQRGREWCYSQPDYLLGSKCINKRLRRVALCSPRYHDSDHRAVVATFWGGSARWLKSYQRDQQCFPLQLSQGEETEQTKAFSCLFAKCVKPELRKRQGNDWISDKTWAFVRRRTALQQVRKMLYTEGRRTKRLIWASLHDDRVACTKGVGKTIKAELEKGDVQEASRLLKGWYRAVLETVVRPCPQMMVRQTEERMELNRWRDSPGEPPPINLKGLAIPDDVPSDHEIRDAAGDLPSGHAEGCQKCARRTLSSGSVALRWRKTLTKGPTMWEKEEIGASLSVSSRLFGHRAKS